MSILSDSKILENIKTDDIVISPFERRQLGSNSYDVRLSENLLIYQDDVLDPRKEQGTEPVVIPEVGFLLKPGRLYLGVTSEYTETKKHVVLFEGKSSLARLGLFVHITAGFGDVGFKGHITLELFCVQPIKIYPNMRIGQIYYQTVEGMVINPYNKKEDAKYNNDTPMPMKSQMFKTIQQDELYYSRKNRIGDSGISFDPTDYENMK